MQGLSISVFHPFQVHRNLFEDYFLCLLEVYVQVFSKNTCQHFHKEELQTLSKTKAVDCTILITYRLDLQILRVDGAG